MKFYIAFFSLLFISCSKSPERKELSNEDTSYNLYRVDLIRGDVAKNVEEDRQQIRSWRVAVIEGLDPLAPEISEEGFVSCEKELYVCLEKVPDGRILLKDFGEIGPNISYDDLYIEEARSFRAKKIQLKNILGNEGKNSIELWPRSGESEVEIRVTLEKSCQAKIVNFNGNIGRTKTSGIFSLPGTIKAKWIELYADCMLPNDLAFDMEGSGEREPKKTAALEKLEQKFQEEKTKKLKMIENERESKRAKILLDAQKKISALEVKKNTDKSMSKLESYFSTKTAATMEALRIKEMNFSELCLDKNGMGSSCQKKEAKLTIISSSGKRQEHALNSLKTKKIGLVVADKYLGISLKEEGFLRIAERKYDKSMTNDKHRKMIKELEKLIEIILLDELLGKI